jgi:cytochrome bd-type quinol oxidase subunit 1
VSLAFGDFLTNPWALIQYAHNTSGAVVTGAFVMVGVGAYYLLQQKFVEHARIFLRVGVIAGIAVTPTPCSEVDSERSKCKCVELGENILTATILPS